MNTNSVCAVIPAQNEESTVGKVVSNLRRDCPAIQRIIVVDDGSTDRTASSAESAGASVIRHCVARGYGSAVKSGILASKEDFVLTLDGDGQHRTADVNRIIADIGKYDLVSGHRAHWLHSSFWRLPGKWLLRRLSIYITKRPVPDLNCGLRLYRRETILKYLSLCSDGYSFTATSLMILMHWCHSINFVPIEVERVHERGRVTFGTGFNALVLLFRIAALLDPLRIFLPMSAVVTLCGIAWGAPYAVAGHGVSVGALLLLLTGLLLFAVGLLSDQISQLRKERLQE